MTNITQDKTESAGRGSLWWGRLKKLFYIAKANAIILAPVGIWLLMDWRWGILTFFLLLAFEIYVMLKVCKPMIDQQVDWIFTMLYGKPLKKEFWAPGEWQEAKKQKIFARPWQKEFWSLKTKYGGSNDKSTQTCK